MAKFLFVFEKKHETDIHNLLNVAQDSQVIPEGITQATETAWIMELPKDVSFLARLVVAAEKMPRHYAVFEVVS